MRNIVWLLFFSCFYSIYAQNTLQVGDLWEGGYVYNLTGSNSASIVKIVSQDFISYDDALLEAENLELENPLGWSVPSVEELLLVFQNVGGLSVFNNTTSYWASSNNCDDGQGGFISFDPYNPIHSTNYNDISCSGGGFLSCFVADVELVYGCSDSSSLNFNPLANVSLPDLCIPVIYGCIDNGYLEFNSNANTDDGSCLTDYVTVVSTLQQALDTWNTKIDLDDGWNMFGYGCPEAINLIDGVSNYSESIMIVKDDWGLAYLPEYGFNGIGDLTPGSGYQIKLSQAIDDFSLCDWYVNDIPEDNIVSLQEENDSLQAELDMIYGCVDETACNYDETAVLDDGSCYNNDVGCGCNTPAPIEGYDCDGNELPLYLVGDFAEGGIVFYVDETGEHGLVAAEQDLVENYMWGCYGQSVDGADGHEVGAGYQNTLDIVAGCVEVPSAASVALAYESGGYDDWFLPSIEELTLMFWSIGPRGENSNGNIAGFVENWYRSSTEATPDWCWGVWFDDGGNGGMNFEIGKDYIYPSRVIRSF